MVGTICIAGKNSIAINGLAYVLNNFINYKIVYIPNKGDDGFNAWQPSFKAFAESQSVARVSLDELYKIRDLIFVSLEFDTIVDPTKFKTHALFNIHFSLLPQYKGVYTSTTPLLFGEGFSGVTLHRIDAGIDTGDIIDQLKFKLSKFDTARDLYLKYLSFGNKIFTKNIQSLVQGKYLASPQSSANSSYFSKSSINYDACKYNLNATAFQIHNQFRAFTFREYQMPVFNNWPIQKTIILEERACTNAGSVLIENDEYFVISTIDYKLKLVKDYYSFLWNAAKSENLVNLSLALNYIEDLELRGREGWNALIIAAYYGKNEAVKMLLQNGANPSTTNHKGTSALMYAFSSYEMTRDDAVLNTLLSWGANKDARDHLGKTLIDYMYESNCLDLMHLL